MIQRILFSRARIALSMEVIEVVVFLNYVHCFCQQELHVIADMNPNVHVLEIGMYRYRFQSNVFNKCDALRNLMPFVQLKKCEKHPWRSVNFSKVVGFCLLFLFYCYYLYNIVVR